MGQKKRKAGSLYPKPCLSLLARHRLALPRRFSTARRLSIAAIKLARRMPQFSYRARNPQGGLVEGVLDCPDRAVAIRQIEQLHYMPVRIELVAAPAPAPVKPGKNGAAKTSPVGLTKAAPSAAPT